jgi:Rap1a immunity proteins
MKRAALAILFLFMPTVTFSAATGNEWRALSPATRDGYLLGVLDAWVLLDAVTKESVQPVGRASIFTRLVGCLGKDMTYGQAIAIVEKYMQDNPSEWHQNMAFLAWIAIDRACAAVEKKAK